MKKESWKAYLYFSKKERRALIILLSIALLLWILPMFYKKTYSPPVKNEELAQYSALLQAKTPEENEQRTNKAKSPDYMSNTPESLFVFDPNKLDKDGWLRLGIKSRTIETIMNFRNKGGKFREPKDIYKIYGLKPEEAQRLVPYIQIDNTIDRKNINEQKNDNTSHYVKKSFDKVVPFDINTATEETWKTLPGIGEVIANRIIKYRNKANGFKSIEQVRKIYGISDSLFQQIKPYLLLNQSS